MKFRRLVALALSVVCVAGAGPGLSAPALAAAAGGQAPAALTISGTVFEADRMTLVPNMALRLRNLSNGMMVGTTVSGANGTFSFDLPALGLYVVEALRGGGVAALGDPVAVAGSAVNTTVVLPQTTAAAASSGYSILLPIAATVGVVGLIVGLYQTSPER